MKLVHPFRVITTKISEFNWDIKAYEVALGYDKPFRTAWGYDYSDAVAKALIICQAYRDDNGISADLVINP